MRTKIWAIHCVLLLHCCHIGCAGGSRLQRQQQQQKQLSKSKVEYSGALPAATGPPEGNTTFLAGTTWCVAVPGVGQADLQKALDWACGEGSADCSPVHEGRECFEPNTLLAHASYAFNSYYQQNGNSDIACNFGGTATLITRNPSYGSCKYLASEPSSAYRLMQNSPAFSWQWLWWWLLLPGGGLLHLHQMACI